MQISMTICAQEYFILQKQIGDAQIKYAFLPLPLGEGWGEGENSTCYPSP